MRNGRLGQVVHLAFVNKQPQLSATVAIADSFRAAALSAFHIKIGANDSFLLSGHRADGAPDKENRHAYYLPIPTLGETPTLTGILVVSPVARFSEEEVAALRTITTLRWSGPSTKCAVELVDLDDQSIEKMASRWESTTPYVPARRFWGTHGKRHLVPEKQLEAELRNTAAAELMAIKIGHWCKIRTRRRPSDSADSANHPAIRSGYRVVFSTSRPILGPIALGHSCHFGLGQFVPAQDD
jgi:CRISPR-associated protein Csb2